MGDIPTPAIRAASASVFVATFAGILILIGALLSFDLFLARVDRRASARHAADEYAAGIALLRQGRAQEAADRFSVAVAIDRANVSYGLALGEASLQDGRTADAEATLRALLEGAENDGAVNLAMAHVMVREGHVAEAKAYFHRAIFGRWRADSLARRTQARSELIDLLVRNGGGKELLAEVLPFEDTSPDSLALLRRLGHLFILAGSPARAANMFREVLRQDSRDADAYAGMGEAALALGNFRTARADLVEASRLRPGDTQIAARLAVADTVLALDPTARGVSSKDRNARSRALLARTVAAVELCGVPSIVGDLARALLTRPTSGDLDAGAEAATGLATDLWAGRRPSCPIRDEALRLVHSRLAQ